MKQIDSGLYSFWVDSRGSGAPVVLLHGLGGSSIWWKRNVDVIAQHRAVHAIDLVGFGRGRLFHVRAPLPPSFDDLTPALGALIRKEFGGAVHLVGHSMGGLVATLLAAQYPDLVRSLTLVGSAGVPFRWNPTAHVAAALHPPHELWRFLPLLVRDLFRSGPTSVGVGALRVLLGDAREALRAVAVPSLLIWGDRDPIIPLAYGDMMKGEIRDAKLVVIPGAGHIPMWDAPEEFNRTITHFFDDVESQTPHAPVDRLFGWGITGIEAGISYRSVRHNTSARGDIVLLHGLGTGSLYFEKLAEALFEKGWNVTAPDLPPYGATGGQYATIPAQADHVVHWAAKIGIGEATWVGHSTGCQVLEAIDRRERAVTRAIHIAPVWSSRPRVLALFVFIALDGLRESTGLLLRVLRAYFDAGLIRIWRDSRNYLADASRPRRLPANALIIAGTRDPLMDWETLERMGRVIRTEGPHGLVYSEAERLARIIDDEGRGDVDV